MLSISEDRVRASVPTSQAIGTKPDEVYALGLRRKRAQAADRSPRAFVQSPR